MVTMHELHNFLWAQNLKLEPDGTEVELASTFRVIVLRKAKMELSYKNKS